MHKYIYILAAVAMTACAKVPAEVGVTFSLGVPSGVITRATPEGLSDAFTATAPVGPFTLNAVSTENPLRSYSVTTGVPITMAVGPYSVTGSGSGTSIQSVSKGKLMSSPSWSVSQTATVSEDGDEISLSASYTCFALVFDLEEVSKVVFDYETNTAIAAFPGNERYAVVYPKPDGSWIASSSLWVYVHPKDEVYGEVALYKIVTNNSDGDFVRVKNGNWYMLSPGRVQVTSGTMGLTFPEWTEGER